DRAAVITHRARSLQSRMSGIVAVVAILVLGALLLVWYYGRVPARARPTRRPVGAAVAAMDNSLPPLGRIEIPAANPAPPPALSTPTPVDVLPAVFPEVDAGSGPRSVSASLPLSSSAPGGAAGSGHSRLERLLAGPAFARRSSAESAPDAGGERSASFSS